MSKDSLITLVFIFMILQTIFSTILSISLLEKTKNLILPTLILISSGLLFHCCDSWIEEQSDKSKKIVVPAKMMSSMPETKKYPQAWESELKLGSYILYTSKINSSATLSPCLAKNINKKVIIESCL